MAGMGSRQRRMILTSQEWSVGRPRKARYGLPSHIHVVRAKGREYFYFQLRRGERSAGDRTKIPGHPFDESGNPNESWWAAYRNAAGVVEDERHGKPGTFAVLIVDFKQSPEWKALSDGTRREWEPLLERVKDAWGDLAVKGIETRHVLALRDKWAATPARTNNMLRALSSMLSWSVPRGWTKLNVAMDVKKLKGGEGYAPWPWDAIDLLQTKARPEMWQAAALALYTGQRQGDVLRMARGDIEGELVSVEVVQRKTKKQLWIPIHKNLKPILAELGKADGPLLRDPRGDAWDEQRFRASWQREMNRKEFVGVRERGLVFHGLRKSAVVMLLEAGATDAEVAAVTGQSREMVEHYARQVSQKKLAAAALLKWEAAVPARD
ncbi:MAG: tyrosine-type recombinase/integrase [Proteobacteria bacterium]|nr:tyrosine-type recombinase/integrase [Pseudomonadota bacterium]